jgi:hypothetical protein
MVGSKQSKKDQAFEVHFGGQSVDLSPTVEELPEFV